MRAAAIILLALVCIAPRCAGPDATLLIRGPCEGNEFTLRWEYWDTLVEIGDCVNLPRRLAERAISCCGELCSGTPVVQCPIACNRLLNPAGEVIRAEPFVLECPS